MATTKAMDIIAKFRTQVTDFSTRQIVDELDDIDDGYQRAETASGQWSDSARRDADAAAAGVEAGAGKIAPIGQEVGSEFSQNIGESIRAGNPLEAVFETATSLGPALGLAGIAVAAGAGVANGILQGIQDHKDRIAAGGAAAFTAFQDGWIGRQAKWDIAAEILGEEDAQAVIKRAREIAAQTSLSTETVVAALRGSQRAQKAVREEIEASQKAQEEQTQVGYGPGIEAVRKSNEALQDLEGYLDDTSQAVRQGAQDWEIYATKAEIAAYRLKELRKDLARTQQYAAGGVSTSSADYYAGGGSTTGNRNRTP